MYKKSELRKSRKHIYIGSEQLKNWIDDSDKHEGGTISPGGAAAILKVSRQQIHNLISHGILESWYYYELGLEKRPYILISKRDIEKHLKKRVLTKNHVPININ